MKYVGKAPARLPRAGHRECRGMGEKELSEGAPVSFLRLLSGGRCCYFRILVSNLSVDKDLPKCLSTW